MSSMFGGSGYGPTGGMQASGLKGTGYRQVTLPNFTPEQMQLFKQMFSNVSPESFTSRLAAGDQSQFEQMEAPALEQFSGLLGGLGSRFSGMGTMGARGSSGFQNTATSAARQFAQQLQSGRLGIQQQALRDLMTMSGLLLGQKPFEQALVQKQPSFLQQLLSGLAGGASQMGGTLGGLYAAKKLDLI